MCAIHIYNVLYGAVKEKWLIDVLIWVVTNFKLN